jgi:hypothetical protein
MELDKILKAGIEYLSDYVEDFLQVIRKPGLHLRPTPIITEGKEIVTVTDSETVQLRLNPRLVRFLFISIFIGSLVNERIPGRPPAQQLLVISVILIVYWVLFSTVAHIICRAFGSQVQFIATLSAGLQVFAVVYVLTSCCAFLWGVIVEKLPLQTGGVYMRWLTDHPVHAYFVAQLPLTFAYLVTAMTRIHKFAFQKRYKVKVLHVALPQLEFVALCFVLLLTTVVIMWTSKFNYEVHNIPLDSPELQRIEPLLTRTQTQITTTEVQSHIKAQSRSTAFKNSPVSISGNAIKSDRAEPETEFEHELFQATGVNMRRLREQDPRRLWARLDMVNTGENFKTGTLVFFSGLTRVGVVADERGFYHYNPRHGLIYSEFNEYWLKRIDGFRREDAKTKPPSEKQESPAMIET